VATKTNIRNINKKSDFTLSLAKRDVNFGSLAVEEYKRFGFK
jgi:hypothetical protein